MKFLVLGASGMAGHMISIYLAEAGYDVTGFSRRKIKFVNTIKGDVRNIDRLSNIIIEGRYNVIINAIGILNQFAENDHEAAVYLNGYLPHFLAKVTAEMDTWIIHISTDCVFSGKNSPYRENDFHDGETFYDRSKSIGELNDKKNLTLRNSIVGPDINRNGIGLLNWFMQQKGEVNGYLHAIWSGQTTLQLAKTMEAAAIGHPTGLINMVHEGSISKYELLRLFNHYIRYDECNIIPCDEVYRDMTLERTNNDWDYDIPDYDTMVKEMSEWIRKHKELYPHYKL